MRLMLWLASQHHPYANHHSCRWRPRGCSRRWNSPLARKEAMTRSEASLDKTSTASLSVQTSQPFLAASRKAGLSESLMEFHRYSLRAVCAAWISWQPIGRMKLSASTTSRSVLEGSGQRPSQLPWSWTLFPPAILSSSAIAWILIKGWRWSLGSSTMAWSSSLVMVMVSCGVALGLLLLGELPVGTAGTLAAAWGRSASNNASTGTSAGRLEASEPKSKSKALLHPPTASNDQ